MTLSGGSSTDEPGSAIRVTAGAVASEGMSGSGGDLVVESGAAAGASSSGSVDMGSAASAPSATTASRKASKVDAKTRAPGKRRRRLAYVPCTAPADFGPPLLLEIGTTEQSTNLRQNLAHPDTFHFKTRKQKRRTYSVFQSQ